MNHTHARKCVLSLNCSVQSFPSCVSWGRTGAAVPCSLPLGVLVYHMFNKEFTTNQAVVVAFSSNLFPAVDGAVLRWHVFCFLLQEGCCLKWHTINTWICPRIVKISLIESPGLSKIKQCYQISCFPVKIISTTTKDIAQLCRIKQAEWEKRQTLKEQERGGH